MSFADELRALEARFASQADHDRDLYLPNLAPAAPVDAVLIAMEPSATWAKTREQAAARLAAGFRNFIAPDLPVWVLHHCARHTLVALGGTYHITDVSKGSMLVAKANVDRAARYARWADLLREELALVAKPGARVVALGKQVRSALHHHDLDRGRDVTTVIHYSGKAARHRNTAVLGREGEFEAYARGLHMDDIVATAQAVLHQHAVPTAMAEEQIAGLRRANLSTSIMKLAFTYHTAFAARE